MAQSSVRSYAILVRQTSTQEIEHHSRLLNFLHLIDVNYVLFLFILFKCLLALDKKIQNLPGSEILKLAADQPHLRLGW